MLKYWYLWLIFAVLSIITVFVIALAGRAVSYKNKETKKILDELDKMKALKDKYKELTVEKATQAEPSELLDGVVAVLQAKVMACEDAEEEFLKFNIVQQDSYILKYFIEDVRVALSFFFRNNGTVLIEPILEALDNVGESELSQIVKKEYEMFDITEESISLDPEKLKVIDAQFVDKYSEERLLENIKKYICDNVDEL